MRMTRLRLLLVLPIMAVAGVAMAVTCPKNCKCDAYGNVIGTITDTVSVNSGNSTTNKQTYNTTTTETNSNNTDKSIHNTAQGGAGGTGGSANQHESQTQAITNSGDASLSNVGNATASADNSGNTNASGNSTNVQVQGATYRAARIPVSTAYSASLTSGLDTCLGSVSAGAQTSFLGLTIGGTKRDPTCEFIKKAHLAAETSPRAACFYIRKHDAGIDEAFKDAGEECPPKIEPLPLPPTDFVTHDELREHEKRIIEHTLSK